MEQASAIRGHVSHDGVLVCTVTLPRQCCHPAASRLHGPFYHRITRLGFPWSSRRLRGDQAPASRPIGIARHRRGRPASSAGQRTTTMPPSVPNSTGPMRVGRIESRIQPCPNLEAVTLASQAGADDRSTVCGPRPVGAAARGVPIARLFR